MTNTELLKRKIEDSGKTIVHLAKQLNLTTQGLYNKINDKTGFYSDEIVTLSKELDLSKSERENIFLTQKLTERQQKDIKKEGD